MNSCEHNFLIAIGRKCTHFFHNFFFSSASDTTSHVWDDAVCTKLVTAVLYFNICPCVFCSLGQMEFFVFFRVIDINDFLLHKHTVCFFSFLLILLKNLDQILLLIISDDNINTFIDLIAVFLRLHITSRRHNDCIWIHLFCPMDHLS